MILSVRTSKFKYGPPVHGLCLSGLFSLTDKVAVYTLLSIFLLFLKRANANMLFVLVTTGSIQPVLIGTDAT